MLEDEKEGTVFEAGALADEVTRAKQTLESSSPHIHSLLGKSFPRVDLGLWYATVPTLFQRFAIPIVVS